MVAEMANGCVVEDVVTLLSSPKSNSLLSGKGHKVPISELQGKVVGLYFYSHWSDWSDDSRELTKMCKELMKRGEDFRLVFIFVQVTKYGEKAFMKKFRGTNWLALPFSQRQRESNKKLYDRFCLFGHPYKGAELVIIRPGDNIAHTYAMDIYRDYGIEAYPFSKSKVTDIEVARLKSLTLDSVLFPDGEDDFFITQDGQQIPASHLVGKNILLFFTTQPFDSDDDDPDVLRDKLINEKVISWYNEIKHMDETFEMIRVFYLYDPRLVVAGESYNEKMPWLEFPYHKHDMDAIYHNLLQAIGDTYNNLPMFVAFGREGQFITLKSLGPLIDLGKDNDCPNFFNDVDLYTDVRDYIATEKMWSSEDEETGCSSLQRCSGLHCNAKDVVLADEEPGRSSLQKCSGLHCNANDVVLADEEPGRSTSQRCSGLH